jgi:hypothetical protein
MAKLITRIKGGLGNQLFCYAAARRLALTSGAELVIDDVTGFARDHQYRRHYSLGHFEIPARKATPAERMEPFERYRRGVSKFIAGKKSFFRRRYLEQEGIDLDPRILDFKVRGTVYLDGYWQSEEYFKDIEQTIREDLRIIPPEDPVNREMALKISQCNAVAVHVRFFDAPDGKSATHNSSKEYYQRAFAAIGGRVANPHFFLFSDDPVAAGRLLRLPAETVTYVSHNQGDPAAYADLWLMTRCRHFIIANSTFSWWGAWLGEYEAKIIIAPDITLTGHTSWGFPGQLPGHWLKL